MDPWFEGDAGDPHFLVALGGMHHCFGGLGDLQFGGPG